MQRYRSSARGLTQPATSWRAAPTGAGPARAPTRRWSGRPARPASVHRVSDSPCLCYGTSADGIGCGRHSGSVRAHGSRDDHDLRAAAAAEARGSGRQGRLGTRFSWQARLAVVEVLLQVLDSKGRAQRATGWSVGLRSRSQDPGLATPDALRLAAVPNPAQPSRQPPRAPHRRALSTPTVSTVPTAESANRPTT